MTSSFSKDWIEENQNRVKLLHIWYQEDGRDTFEFEDKFKISYQITKNFRAEIFGSLEHHVFKEMCDPSFSRRFVSTAHSIPLEV